MFRSCFFEKLSNRLSITLPPQWISPPIQRLISLRSCFEFISENIGSMFLMILFHHLTSIASYVRINDGTKGQKQIPIDPKQNGE